MPVWILVLGCRAPEVPPIRLVPEPAIVEPGDGALVLAAGTRVVGDPAPVSEADQLAGELRDDGLAVEVGDASHRGDIVLMLAPDAGFPAEGYTLDVDRSGILVTAGDAAGLFYGGQTLRQLIVDGVVPFVHVEDAPRFGWRGAMIDVARHFFGVETLEREVDAMAAHKLNRLHVHLTDDQGWRLEILAWPELTAIGASTEVGGGPGGFYTQDEYRELVAYAADRHVVVVPEIDLPGHCTAALASIPALDETGVAPELYTSPAPTASTLWLDGAATTGFVEDVLGEVAGLTPGPWLHVGADEASATSSEDYAAFEPWVHDVVADSGKTMIGWDELGAVDVPAPYVVQEWIDADRARAAVDRGATMTASPAEHAYFDMVYDGDAEFGQVWAGAIDVERAYDWEPVPDGVDPAAVEGVEAALWTELIADDNQLEFMLWPRLAATAEVGWSDERDWDGFRGRLAADGPRLDALGIRFYPSPEVDW
jgi:hexosaminidase